MKISVVSGGFDPIHSGHISYLESAKKISDHLIVLLNSDNWLINKKGKCFMSFSERKTILNSLECVDEVYGFKDDEKGSCSEGLKKIKRKYKKAEIIFCNGGDRNKTNIPEMDVSGIKFNFSIGGQKKLNSSSNLLENWSTYSEVRDWGSYKVVLTDSKTKVKELVISPKQGMSFQRHFHRNEIWFISEGKCKVKYSKKDPENYSEIHLVENDVFTIKKEEWHQIINDSENLCKIIEIQYGAKVEESDIERLYFFSIKDL